MPDELTVERTAPLTELISMLLSCQRDLSGCAATYSFSMSTTLTVHHINLQLRCAWCREAGEMLVEIFSTMLGGDGAMQPRHVCSIDPVGKGCLMWALGTGFNGAQGNNSVARFSRLHEWPTPYRVVNRWPANNGRAERIFADTSPRARYFYRTGRTDRPAGIDSGVPARRHAPLMAHGVVADFGA